MNPYKTLNDGIERDTTDSYATVMDWLEQKRKCSAIVLTRQSYWKRIRVYGVLTRPGLKGLRVQSKGGYWFTASSVEAEKVSYKKIDSTHPQYAQLVEMASLGQNVCLSEDHNEDPGCSNPDCFKYVKPAK